MERLNFQNKKSDVHIDSIDERIKHYRIKVITTGFICGIIINLALMLYHFFFVAFTDVINFILPLIVLSVSLFGFLKTRNIIFYGNVTIVILFLGLFCTIILPHSENAYIILLVLFPYYVLQLKSFYKAIYYIVLYYTFFILYVSLAERYDYPLMVHFSFSKIIMILLSISIGLIIYYYDQKLKILFFNELMKEKNTDRYTGLLNKEALLNDIDKGKNHLVAIIKIENFEELVGVFGYEVYERIYQIASTHILSLKLRFNYEVFKLVNSEFGILVKSRHIDFTQVNAEEYLNSVFADLSRKTFFINGIQLNIIYRIGGFAIKNKNVDKALTKAKYALKKAKEKRKTVYVFQDNEEKKSDFLKVNGVDYLKKLSTLMDNMNQNLLKVYYQPIVSSDNCEIHSYEALLRIYQDKKYMSVFPFLEIAKATEIYDYFSEYVLKDAVKKIKENSVSISINITLQDILNPGYLRHLKRELSFLKEKKLILEIVETDDLADIVTINQFIDEVKEIGCLIAIDDFGSGYSNLNVVFSFSDFQYLKIDGELVKLILNNEKAKMMVESVLLYCRENDYKTIAEHVEDETILSVIQEMGFDYCQGYYCGIPSPGIYVR